MELKYSKDSLEIKRVLSNLDKFLLNFVKILNLLKIRYVIISGYVAILFGRSRVTEDIDMFVDNIGKETFIRLLKEIEKKGLWILNTSSPRQAFDMLQENAIRIAKKDNAIPNIEIKIGQEEDRKVLDNPLKARINGFELFISPIEIQIAFKLWLGSEKDIEDAVYLFELFKDKLDRNLLIKKCKELNVLETMIKYVK